MNSLCDSLYHHILEMMYAVPAGCRFGAHWEMNQAWHDELERLFGDLHWNPNFNRMLGYKVEIIYSTTEGFPKFVAPEAIHPDPAQTVPEHHHDLDGREVAEALAKYLNKRSHQ